MKRFLSEFYLLILLLYALLVIIVMVQGLSFYENGIESITVFKSNCWDGSLSMTVDGNGLYCEQCSNTTQALTTFVVL